MRTDTSTFLTDRGRGIIYGAMAGITLGLGGLIVRLMSVDADGWHILGWRSLAFAGFMFTVSIVRTGSLRQVFTDFTRAGILAPLIALALGLGQIFYLMGLVHTSVANVTFLLGSAPLFVALAAWLVLGEVLTARGLLALAGAMTGIGIMFSGGISDDHLVGVLYAIGALATYVALVIMLRIAGQIDTFAASGLGGLISAATAIWMADGDISLAPGDAVLSIISGIFQVGAGFVFITLATKLIKAAEVSMLVLIEAILAPLLVWYFIGETPGTTSLAGGAIVIGSVAIYSLITIAREKRRLEAGKDGQP
ncbi:MAG: DMT family transporter [Rhizobiales bacterium]|nr:DMT family transporter [Hyphomicrobiales bacterium]